MSKNKFEIGEKVCVLDEDLTGIVKSLNKNSVDIETDMGFVISYPISTVISLKKNQIKASEWFQNTSIQEVIKNKNSSNKNIPLKKSKTEKESFMEVDLHIHQLVKSERGMSNFDMLTLQLETAKRKLEFAIQKKIQKVVFIHGVGEGVLKMELEFLLNRYPNVKFYEASFQKYGQGATEVYIYQNTPSI